MRTPCPGRLALAATLLLAGAPTGLRAQSVSESIQLLATENARLYLHPITTGIGAALNSSWYRSARVRAPFHFDVGIAAMGALVPNANDRFRPILPATITFRGTSYHDPYGTGRGPATPTAVGAGAGATIQPTGDFRQALLDAGENPDAYALLLPEGYDIPAVPMAVLQGRASLPFGNEVTLRLLPTVTVDQDVGAIRSFGAGLKHSVTHWLPGFPLDVSLEGGLASIQVGDYLKGSVRNAALVVGRDFSVLTLFAAGELEHSDVTIRYTIRNPNLPGDQLKAVVRDRGDNSSRFTAGFSLDFFILKLTAAYSASSYNVVSAGVSFGY
jgi:hypothetical protein